MIYMYFQIEWRLTGLYPNKKQQTQTDKETIKRVIYFFVKLDNLLKLTNKTKKNLFLQKYTWSMYKNAFVSWVHG